jgi:hypothetical protein
MQQGQELLGEDKPKRTSEGKKPYQKPSFRHERVFERSALSCGKIVATQANCRQSKKTS